MDLLVADGVRYPGGTMALRRAGLGSCLGCAMNPFETVAEAARELGLDPARVEKALRKLTPAGDS